MKHYLLFLSAVSVFLSGSMLVSCRVTYVSSPSASGTGSAVQSSAPAERLREQPKVVVVSQPVQVGAARPTIQPSAPAVTAKRWVPLVVAAPPAEAVKQYTDGRKYMKSKDGYFYWEGYDHRWYMEENDLKKVSYTDAEYIDWTTKGKQQSHSIADLSKDRGAVRQPGNSAFGHSRGNLDKVEKAEKEMAPNHNNGLANNVSNGDKNMTVQPGNSTFGHNRGNLSKVESPEKEKNPNHANGLDNEKEIRDKKDREEKLAKEREQKEHMEKEVKDKKDREEKLAKEREQKERMEKELKDKKDREEKLVKEREQKERMEKEVKDKKDHEEKLAKEREQKERIEKEMKDKKYPEEKLSKGKGERESAENKLKNKKDDDKKISGEKIKKQAAEKEAKKDQIKPGKDLVKEKV